MKEQRKDLQKLTRMAIFIALSLVMRQLFSFWGNVQPITALFMVLVVNFGLLEGILVMALSMLLSSFLLGFGIWVPFQIISFSLILLLWHQLFPLIKKWPLIQAVLAGSLSFLYGIVIDSFLTIIYGMPWWTYVVAGITFNLAHAYATVLFYPLINLIFRRIFRETYF